MVRCTSVELGMTCLLFNDDGQGIRGIGVSGV